MKTRIVQSTSEEPPEPPHHARPNLAGRMGRWSAHHRKTAIFGWLGFVVVAFVVGTMIGATKIDNNTSGVGESGRADRILDAGFQQPAGETVLIQSRTVNANDPAFQAVVADVVAKVSAFSFVENVRSPAEAGDEGQISPNGRAALVDFDIKGDAIDAPTKINPVVDAMDEIQQANPDYFVGEFGDASTDKQIEGAFLDDLAKAGMLSLPVTLFILIVVFGSLVAAGIPLVLALTAIFATFGLIAIPSSLVPIDETVYELILLIGLAVGVDYSMFYLKREREERAAGRSEEAALQAAASTSGRSVLISGLTVIIAMAGMFFAGIQGMTQFGLGTIMVVAVAMVGSLTVLPAILAWLGDRVDKGRVPFVARIRRDGSDGRIWGAIIDRVLRRPLVSIALSGGLLIALALPALQLHIVNASPETFPADLPVIKTYKQLQTSFPGDGIPANVVVKAEDVRSPEAESAIADLKRRALASNQLNGPITVDVNRAGTVASITVPVNGSGSDGASGASLAVLRDDIVPVTVGTIPGAEVGVTGFTAESKDFSDKIKAVAPLVFGFVLVFAFGLLLFAFRSLVIAAKAIVLNLLSVAAAYGILVLVFQHGFGKGLLGFESTAGIDSFLPIFIFVILFGLSMDYHVFILSRIREAYDRGMSTEESVTYGIKTTAGVVTSAAIVMVCVFSVFATLQMLIFKQFGVGLAAAILIDATVVRAVLLPASMKVLGDWNWYLPSWLEWLPHLEHGGSIEPVRPAPPITAPPALGPTAR